jgi:hypothetical protein
MESSEAYVETRKRFIEDLKILCKSEYEEIFRILKRDNCAFSENYNGIFFDVNTIPEETFEKMVTYMSFCKAQRMKEMDRMKEQEEYKIILGNVDKSVKTEIFNETVTTK